MLSIEEIKGLIMNDEQSQEKRQAKVGERYYNAEHDIKYYELYYINADGKPVRDTTRSNIKISHPFFTEIADQTVQYILPNECFVESKIDILQEELDKYFDCDFISELQETLKDVIVKGCGYMYAYMSEGERSKFMYADSMGIIEVKESYTSDKTNYLIYWYIEKTAKRKNITRIQVWDKKQTWYYVQDGEGGITTDTDVEINPRPHILFKEEAQVGYSEYGFIPFFRMDNNRGKVSGLKPIKELIDDYDLMSCGLSNNLQDITEAIYVVKGFKGENLGEMINNVRVTKLVGVDEDGGIDVKTIDVPFEARKAKLELDEKNIYRFGMAFNSSQIGDGNITNIVIKSRYALLDLKCNKLQKYLKSFLNKLVKVALKEINERNESGYTLDDIEYKFEREIMTNAKDNAEIDKIEAETKLIQINTLLNTASAIGEENIVRSICEVLDMNYDDIKSPSIKLENETNLDKLLEETGLNFE